VAVALADKLDQLAGFFAVGEKPTGSGDPYALRRAALGVIRIVREAGRALQLWEAIWPAFEGCWPSIMDAENLARRKEIAAAVIREGRSALLDNIRSDTDEEARRFWRTPNEVLDFLLDRLRVQLRAEGARHDLVAASIGEDDDILRILARADALKSLVESEAGTNLLAAYKRAQNILRIEEKKDGPHSGPVDEAALAAPEEQALNTALARAEAESQSALAREDFAGAMAALASLRGPTDAFFENILVNDPAFRNNRLRLLSRLRAAMDAVADLSKIEA
jgi:glycyl-tRNA synthetase beta chain